MIGYVTIGTSDLERARTYYSSLLGTIGAKELMRMDHGFTMYGTKWGKPSLVLTPPADGKAQHPGNGNMVAIPVDTRAAVDAFYAKGLELGGKSEGLPGLRGPEGAQAFYGAYFRDPDGNKLCVFRMGPA
jgi:catechol 2,3-dioxygenase-like lactoylglutathione lyase family enzyme